MLSNGKTLADTFIKMAESQQNIRRKLQVKTPVPLSNGKLNLTGRKQAPLDVSQLLHSTWDYQADQTNTNKSYSRNENDSTDYVLHAQHHRKLISRGHFGALLNNEKPNFNKDLLDVSSSNLASVGHDKAKMQSKKIGAGNRTERKFNQESADELRKAFAEDYQLMPNKVVHEEKQLTSRKSFNSPP